MDAPFSSIEVGAASADHPKEWFMDALHPGDKLLFSADCDKNNHCAIEVPNPEEPDKVSKTMGWFYRQRPQTSSLLAENACHILPIRTTDFGKRFKYSDVVTVYDLRALAQVWCRLVLHKSAIYQIPSSLLTFPQLRAER